MSTGEQHIVHVEDEEDGTPIWCVLTVQAMVLIAAELVSIRTSSSITDIRDVHGLVTQSLAVAPYIFPRLDHHGEMSFSHPTEEAPSPRA
jgi:hypothetical protein